ncbi:MAG TPA: DUF3461 family protein [Sedimenticola thiotaurini]|uniref:DUF3461 family protein n=1 Tax=Sedimenticola thiotaurini TaxID=1543721 RepID=A0A831RPN5_9GAMM|nr:DUF3461 family protein [Sedimenticola thiotaurini]
MYETLKEMGVTDIDHIEKYTLRQEGDEDILKIYYRRKKGDIFSRSIKFRHGRSTKVIPVNSGRGEYKEVSEISPTILKAVEELEQIVQHEESIQDFKKRILSDIDHLERVVQRKLDQLRQDVSRLE